MTTDIRGSLAGIEASLGRLARPTLLLLRPGIAADSVRPLLTSRDLEPPPDLLALWEWRNGTDTSTGVVLGDLWLVPGFYLLSVDEAIENFDAWMSGGRWEPSWLPVLANGGGDFLAVKCSGVEAYGGVYRFRFDEANHPLEFETVSGMIATFAAAFDRGVFFVDGEGFLEEDYGAFTALAAERNPSVGWWHDQSHDIHAR